MSSNIATSVVRAHERVIDAMVLQRGSLIGNWGGRQALRTWRCGGDEAACSDKSQRNWTQERANKLALAFGDRWQSECFPNSIWFW